MNLHIRKATIGDLKVIQLLSQELFEYEKSYTDQYNLAWSFSPAGEKFFSKHFKGRMRFILVAETDGMIVGYAALWIGKLSWRTYNPIVEIENLCVFASRRGKGIGTALMTEIFRIAKKRKAKIVRVTAFSDNDRAFHFYRTHGYRDVNIILEKNVL